MEKFCLRYTIKWPSAPVLIALQSSCTIYTVELAKELNDSASNLFRIGYRKYWFQHEQRITEETIQPESSGR